MILVVAWALIGVLTTAAGIHQTMKIGFDKSYLFFIMAAISFLMAWYRNNQRKKQQKLK